MPQQVAVTIVAPVRPARLDDLRQLLDRMGDDVAGNDVVPFGRLRDVHFARLVVLDATTDVDGRAIGPKLVYLSDVDGSLASHVEDLVDVAGAGIDELFGHCEGYPEASATRRQRLACLYAWMAPAAAVYVNTIGRTVAQIEREDRLRDEVERYLDGHDLVGSSPAEVRAELLTLRGQRNPTWRGPCSLTPGRPLAWRAGETLHFAGGVAVAVVCSRWPSSPRRPTRWSCGGTSGRTVPMRCVRTPLGPSGGRGHRGRLGAQPLHAPSVS